MRRLLYIVHFLLKNLAILIKTNVNIKPLLYGAALNLALIICNNAFAEINIAIIDTGFCPEKIKLSNKQIKISAVLDLTDSVKLDCQSLKFDKSSPRFHGQLVLEEFLKFFNDKNLSIKLHPLIVFNSRGDQKSEYWIKAIEWVKKNKMDMVVSAAGLIVQGTDKIPASILPAVWFIPSGRTTPQIKKEAKLFPQCLAPQKNLFLIGDYYDGRQVLYDQGLLYQDKIDYYFPSGTKQFSGTSRAVAEASARAISLCPLTSRTSMRECLKKKSKEYIDNLSARTIKTF